MILNNKLLFLFVTFATFVVSNIDAYHNQSKRKKQSYHQQAVHQKPLSPEKVNEVAQHALKSIKIKPNEDVLKQLEKLSEKQQFEVLDHLLKLFFSSHDRTPLRYLLKVAQHLPRVQRRYSTFFSIMRCNNGDLVEVILQLRDCNNNELPRRVQQFKDQARNKVNVSIFKSVRIMVQECLDNHYAYLYRKVY